MKTIQQIAQLSIAVYQEYRDRGLSVEEAKQKAVFETVEANEDMELCPRFMVKQELRR
jgi:hypothetical protein